jgi:hypothetical protein
MFLTHGALLKRRGRVNGNGAKGGVGIIFSFVKFSLPCKIARGKKGVRRCYRKPF